MSSSRMRESARAFGEASLNGIVHRIVSLPRNIIGGFTRAISCHHGIDLGIGGRRNEQHPPSNFHVPYPPQPPNNQQEWAFLSFFEQQYGTTHPFFYACKFMETLKIAEDEQKFMFMYIHSPEHPFTPSFCKETLCSEVIVQFLDANFVCWGTLANKGEGMQMTAMLNPATFPCCAVVAPAPGESLAVLQQMEGPISPGELVEILQRTLDVQGLAFGSGRAKEEENKRMARRLKEEQDAAYFAALQIDKEKEKVKNLPSESRVHEQAEGSNKANYEKYKHNSAKKEHGKVKTTKESTNQEKNGQITRVLIRFPNGERREQSFSWNEKLEAVYKYIDSLGITEIGNYRLVSNFPRKVYGVDHIGITLKDAGLHPKATLFLELL